MEANFDCIICLSLAEEPFLTTCCNILLCKTCLNQMQSRQNTSCPQCKKQGFTTKGPGAFVKRIIGNMPKECPGCGLKTTVSEYKIHENKCPKKEKIPFQKQQPKIRTKDEIHKTMIQHKKNCQHEGCSHVWKNKKGPFIGGKDGKKYWDFTKCQLGKQLNTEIGWDEEYPYDSVLRR